MRYPLWHLKKKQGIKLPFQFAQFTGYKVLSSLGFNENFMPTAFNKKNFFRVNHQFVLSGFN